MHKQTPPLAGKTIFITGASRGIGLAMAERFGRDGANLILTGKTLQQHDSLPGSLEATAERVRAAGGQALALLMDVRDEASVRQAAEQGAAHFGGIDVCINNAGAFWMQPSMETSVKRHDLLFGVNERGCYLATQACYPYLRQAANPHILNISPPLDLRGVWLQHTSPYTVSKYAMSLYALGWSKEFAAEGIAANCLWPRSGIESPAALFHGGEELRSEFRKASIMADAAYAIISKPARSFTGQLCIDDSLLYAEGVRDFESYSVVPGAALVPDYFVPQSMPAPPGVRLSAFRLYPLDDEPAESAPT